MEYKEFKGNKEEAVGGTVLSETEKLVFGTVDGAGPITISPHSINAHILTYNGTDIIGGMAGLFRVGGPGNEDFSKVNIGLYKTSEGRIFFEAYNPSDTPISFGGVGSAIRMSFILFKE